MIWTTDLFEELDQMRRGMRPLWEGALAGDGLEFPPVNIYEGRDEYALILCLPGVPKDKVEIRFAENTVTLSGERPEQVLEEKSGYLRRERDWGRFERAYRFPVKVNADGASAKLENGILVLTVPKADEAKPKQITIQA